MSSPIEHPESQERHLADVAFLARALADENRLRILLFVRHGRKSVSQIVEELGLSQPLVSHHLRELKRALLVDVERRGPFVLYGLTRIAAVDVIEAMRDLAGKLVAERIRF